MNEDDVLSMLRIMQSSTQKQLESATSDTIKTYLEGYLAAVKMMLEFAEKK